MQHFSRRGKGGGSGKLLKVVDRSTQACLISASEIGHQGEQLTIAEVKLHNDVVLYVQMLKPKCKNGAWQCKCFFPAKMFERRKCSRRTRKGCLARRLKGAISFVCMTHVPRRFCKAGTLETPKANVGALFPDACFASFFRKQRKAQENHKQQLSEVAHSHSVGTSKATKVVFPKKTENVKKKVASLGKVLLVRNQKCGGWDYRDF